MNIIRNGAVLSDCTVSACRKSRNKKLIIVNLYDIAKPSLEGRCHCNRSDGRVEGQMNLYFIRKVHLHPSVILQAK